MWGDMHWYLPVKGSKKEQNKNNNYNAPCRRWSIQTWMATFVVDAPKSLSVEELLSSIKALTKLLTSGSPGWKQDRPVPNYLLLKFQLLCEPVLYYKIQRGLESAIAADRITSSYGNEEDTSDSMVVRYVTVQTGDSGVTKVAVLMDRDMLKLEHRNSQLQRELFESEQRMVRVTINQIDRVEFLCRELGIQGVDLPDPDAQSSHPSHDRIE